MSRTRFAALVLLVAVCSDATLFAQVEPEVLELRNWSAPPFWSPPARKSRPDVPEPEVGGLHPAEELDVLGGLPTSPLPFVGINPCRIVDTRGNGFTGQAGPPTLPGFTTRVFQVAGTVAGIPTQCGIPLTAQAVSFQFSVTTIAANGNLIAWPEGPPPTTSVLNWNANSVAIGSGTVVALSATGALSVRINGPGADLIIDVNGYYGDNFDSLYVNEGQASSITSAMIADGAIVNADINAAAAIADTKLATIATAGKVADTALSSNVTMIGQTIESGEITDGTIVNADVNASAAIADTKLATIATAGKVADSALSSNVSMIGSTIESAEITNGTIVNADINAAAAIVDTKLATIATAGKVADSALSSNVSMIGSTIESAEITNGTILNADINAVAAIVDTKLATIATAGKVADTALSANVTRLGPTIESGEITNILRSVDLPLASFVSCQTAPGNFLNFVSGADRFPDFATTVSAGLHIDFDDDLGNEDDGNVICSGFMVPDDAVAGGSMSIRLFAERIGAAEPVVEQIGCAVSRNATGYSTNDFVTITTLSFYTCNPSFGIPLPGDYLAVRIEAQTTGGAMDNPLRLRGVAVQYTASQ